MSATSRTSSSARAKSGGAGGSSGSGGGTGSAGGGGGSGGGAAASSAAPPLSLSARDNSCTSALFLPAYGAMLRYGVLDALQVASDTAEFENFCAEKIQATYRMFRQRRSYQSSRRCIIAMQRVYRGHLRRNEVHRNCEGDNMSFEEACFHYYATRIQAIFRGYYCRKYVDDYYARRAYIRRVAADSEMVRTQAAELREEQELENSKARQEKSNLAYVRATERVHFMLSTVGRSGVYRRCAEPTGASTKPFGSNVESDIRENTRRVRREEREKEIRRLQAAKKTGESLEAGAATSEHKRVVSSVNTSFTEADQQHSEVVKENESFDNVYNADLQQMMLGIATRHSSEAQSHSVKQSSSLKKGKNARPGQYGRGCGIAPSHEGVEHYGKERIGPHMLSPSTAQSCPWEETSALPPQRPMIPPSSCCRKDHPDNFKTHSSVARAPPEGPVTAIQHWATPSHFSLKYKGAAHSCVLPPIPILSTYDTETAALKKSVDGHLITKLHERQIFKVARHPPPLPEPLTVQELQKGDAELEERRRVRKEQALARKPKGPRPEEVGAI